MFSKMLISAPILISIVLATGCGGDDAATTTTSPGLVCSYESGWNDSADGGLGAPITPNSFADYETVIADCATAEPFTADDIAGGVFVDTTETITFYNNTGSGTESDPHPGVFDDGAGTIIDVEWYVEDAACTGCNYSYLVIYSDDTIDADLPVDFWFRETYALTGLTGTPGSSGAIYNFKISTEQSNYSDAVRATGVDGEIWSSSRTLQ